MRYLNEACVRTILTPCQLMDAVEEAYRIFAAGECYVPERPSVEYQGKTLLYMPCFTKTLLGSKILTVFPDNRKKGLPAIDGLMLLNDPDTGKPAGLLNGSALTAMRTGAVGGTAMKYFAAPDAACVGLIGTGVQGLHQLIFACSVRKIQEIWLFQRQGKNLEIFIRELNSRIPYPVAIHVSQDLEEVVKNSGIVITATTASSPVLPGDEKLLRGRCYIAIGSYKPDMRELPDELLHVCDAVFTELPYALEETGDLKDPLEKGILKPEKIHFMADYLANKTAVGETVCFKSVGMSVFDLVIADKMMQAATLRELGKELDEGIG